VCSSDLDTPYEFSQALVKALAGRRVSPLVRAKVARLIELYVHTVYSQRTPTTAQQREAIGLWNDVRWELWRAGLQGVRRTLQPTPSN
jgi:hypothetical protein